MYRYEKEKPKIFTDQGQRKFLSIRDETNSLLKVAGAVRMNEIISNSSGDSWFTLACVDRMVELGELREISQFGCAGQDRVFVKAY